MSEAVRRAAIRIIGHRSRAHREHCTTSATDMKAFAQAPGPKGRDRIDRQRPWFVRALFQNRDREREASSWRGRFAAWPALERLWKSVKGPSLTLGFWRAASSVTDQRPAVRWPRIAPCGKFACTML